MVITNEPRFDVVFGHDTTDIIAVIGTNLTHDEAWKTMSAHQKGWYPNLGYYFRCWKHEDGTEVVDFGSHTRFYFFVPHGLLPIEG